MQTRVYVMVLVLISALGAGAQQSPQPSSPQSLQQNPGAQALLQWLHQSNYEHGQYDGLYTATPQQLLERVDRNTVRQLAVTSNVLRRDPNNVNALVLRGYNSLGAADESMYRDSWLHYAAQDFEKALRLDPNNFVAHHDYAETCFEVGDMNPGQPVMHLAVTHFTKAIALKPDSARSYMGRGWAYLMMKDEAHANADFQKTLQLDPSLRPELERESATIRHRLGEIAGAQQTLRAMGSYTVDPTVHTASQCAAKKGYWTNNQCRFTDLGLHQGIGPGNSPGTGTYSVKGGGMVVR